MTRMSTRQSLWTLLAFISFCACAPVDKTEGPPEDPAGDHAEEGGFFPPDHSSLPEPVRTATRSVFFVIVPSSKGATDIETAFGMGTANKAAIMLREKDPVMRAVMLSQIEFCEKEQGFFNTTKKKCQVATFFRRGSGFLLGDGKTLWTANHVLDDAFAPKDLAPIFVIDRDGKSLYDPYADAPTVSKGGDAKDPSHDYAKLVFPKEIGVPLRLANAKPRGNDEIFAIGFPSCTDCTNDTEPYIDRNKRTTGPDAPGNDQRVSRGRPYRVWRAPLIDTTVDVIPGNSGGPGVNAQGEVFGVAILGGMNQFGRKTQRLGAFVVPPEWRL